MKSQGDTFLSGYEIMKINNVLIDMLQKANQALVIKLIRNPASHVMTHDAVLKYGEMVKSVRDELTAICDLLQEEETRRA